MNSIYKLSDMNFGRIIMRCTLITAAVIAIFASAYSPAHADMATTSAATSTAATTTVAANTPPTITLNGAATTTISINTDYADLGATATDTEDGDLTSHIIMTGTVATTSAGTSTLSYSVTDSGGLSASVMRDIVVVDNSTNTATTTGASVATSTPAVSTSTPATTGTSTPSTGSITFCTVAWNGNNSSFATTSAGLPDGTFTTYVNYAGPLSTSTGSTTLSFSPVTLTSSNFSANTASFGSDNNAQCVTESNLDFGYYRYSEENISGTTSTSTDMQWNAPLYHDQYNASVQSLSDFLTYSTTTNQNSDGIISIGPGRPDRTLVILNSFGSTTPTIAPSTGGGTSGGSTSGGGTSGGSTGGSTSGGAGGGSSSGVSGQFVGGGSLGGGTSGGTSGGSSDFGVGGIGGGSTNASGAVCTYLNDYLHIGWNNNPLEVKKLQIFLNTFEQYSLDINGVFDRATFNAVEGFQQKYSSDILTPWGYAPDQPTGYVYILTKKKINELVCDSMVALTPDQQQEIASFNQLMQTLKSQGMTGPSYVGTGAAGTGSAQGGTSMSGTGAMSGTGTGVSSGNSTGGANSMSNGGTSGTSNVGRGNTSASSGISGTGAVKSSPSTGIGLGGNGEGSSTANGTSTGLSKGVLANLAAAVFALPQSGTEFTRCIFNLIIILAIIYIITSILVNNDEAGAAALELSRTRKLWFYLAGVIIATAFALFFDMFCLVAPLLLILIILVIVLIVRKMGGPGSTGTPAALGTGSGPVVTPVAEKRVTHVDETPVSSTETAAPTETKTTETTTETHV